MQASGARRVDLLASLRQGSLGVGVLDLVTVAVAPANALIASRAEGVAAVARGRPVAREDHGGHRGRLARVIEGAIELVNRARPEGITDVGAVEGDAHDRHVGARLAAVEGGASGNPPVVGDVGEVEALDLAPAGRVEGVGNEGQGAHVGDSSRRGRCGGERPRARNERPGSNEGGACRKPGSSDARA